MTIWSRFMHWVPLQTKCGTASMLVKEITVMRRNRSPEGFWKYDALAIAIYLVLFFALVSGWDYLSDTANAFVSMH